MLASTVRILAEVGKSVTVAVAPCKNVHVLTVVCFLQAWLQDEKVLEEAAQKVALLHQKYR